MHPQRGIDSVHSPPLQAQQTSSAFSGEVTDQGLVVEQKEEAHKHSPALHVRIHNFFVGRFWSVPVFRPFLSYTPACLPACLSGPSRALRCGQNRLMKSEFLRSDSSYSWRRGRFSSFGLCQFSFRISHFRLLFHNVRRGAYRSLETNDDDDDDGTRCNNGRNIAEKGKKFKKNVCSRRN